MARTLNQYIEVSNIEIYEFCMLNIITGEKVFSGEKKVSGFTGLYFRNEDTFFALYPTEDGPVAWYDGKEYPITKALTISVIKNDKKRGFSINEYGISIAYKESKFLDFDSWSTEIDVDLFYMIEQRYKTSEFYEQYTKVVEQ